MERPATPGRRALVLGGGGAFGIVQAAYIKAAIDSGFKPDLVIGTSVGALNGAWVAMYPDDTNGLVDVWRGLGDLHVLETNPFRLARKLIAGPRAIARNHLVTRLIADHVGDRQFEDTRLELAIVATNLSRGRKQLFQSGRIGPAIQASTAIPGVFEPFELNGDLFVDGCVTASVDIASALELGATEVLAIELSPPFEHRPARTALGILSQSLGILCHASTDAAEAIAARHAAVRVLRPDLSGLSPWRLVNREGLADEHLQRARTEMASALDLMGRVVPSLTPRPRAIVTAPPGHPRLHLLGSRARRRPAA